MTPESRTVVGADGLAALVHSPTEALIALDYDGTLAPIVADPEQARPAGRAGETLRRAAEVFGSVAVITGRPAADAARLGDLAGVARLLVLGHYGLQRWSGGTLDSPPPVPGVTAARRRLPGLIAGFDGVALEDKTHSLAVHTRGATQPAAALDALREPLDELARDTGLQIVAGRFVLELRPPGTDKGAALRALATERHPTGVLYAGDDLGDLPAYDAVGELRVGGVPGVTVCAASAEVDELAARADLIVDGPDGVVALLSALCDAATGPTRCRPGRPSRPT